MYADGLGAGCRHYADSIWIFGTVDFLDRNFLPGRSSCTSANTLEMANLATLLACVVPCHASGSSHVFCRTAAVANLLHIRGIRVAGLEPLLFVDREDVRRR